jgi:hypothetical protein
MGTAGLERLMWRAQQRLAVGLAVAGLVIVGGMAACWAFVFGERTATEFWLLAVPAVLIPYATVAVAVWTVRDRSCIRFLVGVAGIVVAGTGLLVFRVVASAALAQGEFSSLRYSREWASATAMSWLLAQEVAALIAALASGLTWERRQRYGLWVMFTVALCAFTLLVDYTERLGASAVYEWRFTFRNLIDGRLHQAWRSAGLTLEREGPVVLPALCLGWLAQCLAPRRPRRVPDQAADYADDSPSPIR